MVLIVREADEMKIAQRFSAGSGISHVTRARNAGDRASLEMIDLKPLSSASRTCDRFSRSDPSAEALGYFQTSAFADDEHSVRHAHAGSGLITSATTFHLPLIFFQTRT